MFEKIKELIVESLGIEEDPGNNGSIFQRGFKSRFS